MTRQDFQNLAEERIADADALIAGNRYSGAYYMSGLAVECALKACIAKNTRAFDFPDKERTKYSWTHDLETLAKTAGLKASLDLAADNNSALGFNWNTVKEWQVESRYDSLITESSARELFRSVTESSDGVLPWLRILW